MFADIKILLVSIGTPSFYKLEVMKMNLNLSGKRIIVIGGWKGIGYAIVETFLSAWAKVKIVSRDRKNLKEVANNLFTSTGFSPDYLSFDLAKIDDRISVWRKIGHLDILINNAGSIPGGLLANIKIEDWLASWKKISFSMKNCLTNYCQTGDRLYLLNDLGKLQRFPKLDF